ncbi:deformed epidermal autoregulatory factor 1-like isoform X1 [Portunus trituberculatus]|uniref:deformed epidermal autoregulatory factor 1-like isoform X1 n=1 Tax=Portunus trituberculatus TaxID=210409 RepID=UPI001E1CF44F|nr:deformed epidermal autoregulatory factor 1-like isoform X1 [Portunus trituberculatus]
MEDSVGCAGAGRPSGQGTLGSPRPPSAPLGKVVPAARDRLVDVITSPLRDVINPSHDVTLPGPEVTLTPTAALLTKGDCTSAASSSLLHEVPSPTTTTTTISITANVAAGLTPTTTTVTTTATASITTAKTTIKTTTTTALPDFKTTSNFNIEPDWKEAAQELVLWVRCKKTIAELHKNRFGSGSRGKCIKLGKEWFTPTEFEVHCGRSASKDWKRSIRFQGQSLLTLIEEGFLQMHATSCSCSACLHNEEAAGSIRLHRPFKRKRRERFFLNTEKALKHGIASNHSSPTPTVTLPVSGLGELAVVPGLVLGGATHSPAPLATPPTAGSSDTSPTVSFAGLPLDKAWERMSEILGGLQRNVSQAQILLDELRERTRQETLNLRQKLQQEKDEALAQAKIEAQLSNIAKSSEGFLVQVREDDGNQSLQPIMLDSLISNTPTLNSVAPINGVQKKQCVNCNRESDFECSGCQNRAYCSSFCQRRDWPSHQADCGRSSPTQEDPLNTVSQTPGYIFMLSD